MALDTNTLYIPEPSHRYRGAQVIITSDRLTFNAKNDSMLLYSKRDIGFSAEGSIYFDTNKKSKSINSSKFIVNSPEIYLGLQDEGADINKLPVERAVLGNSLRIFLNELLDVLVDLIDDMEEGAFSQISSEPGKPTIGNLTSNLGLGALRKLQISILKNSIAIEEAGDPDNPFETLADADLCSFLSKRIKLT